MWPGVWRLCHKLLETVQSAPAGSRPHRGGMAAPTLRTITDTARVRAFLDAGGDPNLRLSMEQSLRELPNPAIGMALGTLCSLAGSALALGVGLNAAEINAANMGGPQGPESAILFTVAALLFFGGAALVTWADRIRRQRLAIVDAGDSLTLALAACLRGSAAAPTLRLLIERNASLSLESSNGATAYILAKGHRDFPRDLLNVLFVIDNRDMGHQLASSAAL